MKHILYLIFSINTLGSIYSQEDLSKLYDEILIYDKLSFDTINVKSTLMNQLEVSSILNSCTTHKWFKRNGSLTSQLSSETLDSVIYKKSSFYIKALSESLIKSEIERATKWRKKYNAIQYKVEAEDPVFLEQNYIEDHYIEFSKVGMDNRRGVVIRKLHSIHFNNTSFNVFLLRKDRDGEWKIRRVLCTSDWVL